MDLSLYYKLKICIKLGNMHYVLFRFRNIITFLIIKEIYNCKKYRLEQKKILLKNLFF